MKIHVRMRYVFSFGEKVSGFRCQPRRWVQAPSLIEKETSEGLVSYKVSALKFLDPDT